MLDEFEEWNRGTKYLITVTHNGAEHRYRDCGALAAAIEGHAARAFQAGVERGRREANEVPCVCCGSAVETQYTGSVRCEGCRGSEAPGISPMLASEQIVVPFTEERDCYRFCFEHVTCREERIRERPEEHVLLKIEDLGWREVGRADRDRRAILTDWALQNTDRGEVMFVRVEILDAKTDPVHSCYEVKLDALGKILAVGEVDPIPETKADRPSQNLKGPRRFRTKVEDRSWEDDDLSTEATDENRVILAAKIRGPLGSDVVRVLLWDSEAVPTTSTWDVEFGLGTSTGVEARRVEGA